MAIYIKINDAQYEASITGRLNDKDWDNRKSKAITLEMSYEDAVKTFVDDMDWYILQDVEEMVEVLDEKTGEMVTKTETKLETYDNSEYSMAGDIIDHRNGKVTIKMGQPTAEELLAIFEEAL